MRHGSASIDDLSPLARRRLRREQRRHQKKRATVAAAAALLTVAVALAGVALSRHDAGPPDVSGRTQLRTGPGTGGRDAAGRLRLQPKSPEPVTPSSQAPASKPAPATSAPPTQPVTTAPSVQRPPVQPTTPATGTLPPAATPAAGDIDPQSPPSAPPPGAQGPVRTAACASSGPPVVRPSVVDAPSAQGGWVTVGRLAGNCGGETGPVPLGDVDARLVYRSDASAFQVFLVDQADPSTSSGYADVECDGPCAGVQDLTDQAGRYRIKVAASDAPWEVLLQEYR